MRTAYYMYQLIRELDVEDLDLELLYNICKQKIIIALKWKDWAIFMFIKNFLMNGIYRLISLLLQILLLLYNHRLKYKSHKRIEAL